MVLMGKQLRKRALGRPSIMWEDSINEDLRGVEWSDVDCINLALVREK
jgi:hypothetical protein